MELARRGRSDAPDALDLGCTTGVIRRKMSNTALLAALIASQSVSAITASGHCRRARAVGVPLRTPYARASYDAAMTTHDPTITGRPRSDGSSRWATDA